MAAVKVVLPWSTCPIVPMFTCGLLRSNFSLLIVFLNLSHLSHLSHASHLSHVSHVSHASHRTYGTDRTFRTNFISKPLPELSRSPLQRRSWAPDRNAQNASSKSRDPA